jgi:hypothetical protein
MPHRRVTTRAASQHHYAEESRADTVFGECRKDTNTDLTGFLKRRASQEERNVQLTQCRPVCRIFALALWSRRTGAVRLARILRLDARGSPYGLVSVIARKSETDLPAPALS